MHHAKNILIVAVNARYSHASHSARCLMAALGEFSGRATMLEFDLDVQPFQLAGVILEHAPAGVAFSVYLWNAALVGGTLKILRAIDPALPILLGGPEIVADDARWHGFETVVGEGENKFAAWAADLLNREDSTGKPQQGSEVKSVNKNSNPLPCSSFPVDHSLFQKRSTYDFYTSSDLAQRTVYVESSRGCPFSCAYCTSCNTGLRAFPLEPLFREFEKLIRRGARAFRFLDRSFNADETHACRVLDWFLQRDPGRFPIHLEIIPRAIGPALRERFRAFPPHTLHIEAGVQTLNHEVALAIGRRIPVETILGTLAFLKNDARVLLHADLIFGLPDENFESFARGFDRVARDIAPPELQVNLLKLLPGTPLRRDAQKLGLVFNPEPPYELLSSDVMVFSELTRLQRFARCWELVHNRARFPDACETMLAAPSPFAAFDALADFIHTREGRLHALHPQKWREHIDAFLLK